MAVVERTYTVPLRKEWLKASRYRRAKKAIIALNEFLMRHMKVELKDVRLGRHLNELVWSHGMRCPPPRVRINVQKDDKGIVRAEIVGKPIVIEKKEEAKEKGLASKIKEKITGKEEKPSIVKEEIKIGEDRKEEAPTEDKAKAKPAVKKEAKLEKKPVGKMPAPKPMPAAKKPMKQEIR